jgi:hypothetical protein
LLAVFERDRAWQDGILDSLSESRLDRLHNALSRMCIWRKLGHRIKPASRNAGREIWLWSGALTQRFPENFSQIRSAAIEVAAQA